MGSQNAIDFLKCEFERRKKNNENYSLRSFAKNLGVSASVVSQVLAGKKNISPHLMEQIGTKLRIDPESYQKIMTELIEEKKKNHIKNYSLSKTKEFENIERLELNSISKLYLIELLRVYKISEAFELMKTLNLEVNDINSFLERLKDEGLIEIINDRAVFSADLITLNSLRLNSDVLLKLHDEYLAIRKNNLNMEYKNGSHFIFIISYDKDLNEKIRERVEDFNKSLAGYVLKNSKKKDSVLSFSGQVIF